MDRPEQPATSHQPREWITCGDGAPVALAEFDPDPDGMVTPRAPDLAEAMPERALLCLLPEVIDRLPDTHGARRIGRFSTEIGGHPIYRLDHGGVPVGVFHPGVGAPLAVLHLERAIAAGARMVVVCGAAGALHANATGGRVIVGATAIRDEGTSFHYLPAGRRVDADPHTLATTVAVLTEQDVPHVVGTTWTTDAPYRETPGKVRARRDEGCICVEMEAAALFAVAQVRAVRLTCLLVASDDLRGDVWLPPDAHVPPARARLFAAALDTIVQL